MHKSDTAPYFRDRRITACIPYFRCRQYVRRAVECLLAQTHREITVIVVNDGDPEPPWDLLADIDDPRLVRWGLNGNHGPYFATAAALNSTSAPYFLIQDADDWSSPERAACLLDQLERDGSDLALSTQLHYRESRAGSVLAEARWSSVAMDGNGAGTWTIRPRLTPGFIYRAPHHGLFRSDSIRRVGGYYGGFRMSYDALLTNLILMTGRISHVPQPLYFRLVRPESLTQSRTTGMKSRARRLANRAIGALYQHCFQHYSAFLRGWVDCPGFLAAIRGCVALRVPTADARQLTLETEHLRHVIHYRRGLPGEAATRG